MYNELLERLRDWPKVCALYDGSVDQLHDEAADAIEELQADKAALNGTVTNLLEQIKDLGKPHWITVEERLPEKQGWCVACVFYRGIQWGDITTKGFTSVCPAYYFEGTFHKVSSEAEVTHWMPLPEPPKEE